MRQVYVLLTTTTPVDSAEPAYGFSHIDFFVYKTKEEAVEMILSIWKDTVKVDEDTYDRVSNGFRHRTQILKKDVFF